MRHVFRSLQHRNYRLFFFGQGISVIGTWMQQIAMTWLVYRITNSVFLLGLVGFSTQIPSLFLAPFAGVFADRWNRRSALVATQSLAMVQAFLLAFLTLTQTVAVWHIVVLSIFLGVVNGFDMTIRQSFVIEMVGRKEDIPNAIALNSSLFNSARLIGPSIAGILVATLGEGICFLLNGISYVAVIFALLSMHTTPREHGTEDHAVLQKLGEGFRYAFGFPPIRNILMFIALVSLMSVQQVLMPVFARDIFHGGAQTLGFLVGAAGIGALIGAVYLASRRSVLGLGRLIVVASSIFGSGLIIFSFLNVFLIALPVMVAIGLGMMLHMASSNTILQTIADEDKRGRVMSFYSMAFMGIAPFGSLLGGSLATWIGAPRTLLIGGISVLVGSFIFNRNLPHFQELVHPTYVRMGIIATDKLS